MNKSQTNISLVDHDGLTVAKLGLSAEMLINVIDTKA